MSLTQSQAARRERVVQTAMQMARSGGYDSVQMRDVAAEAGVALGTIYRYFSSKDHLLAAGMTIWLEELEHSIRQRPPTSEIPADRVVSVLRKATRAMEREPLLSAAMVRANTSIDPAVSALGTEMSSLFERVVLASLVGYEKALRPGAARALGFVWLAVLVGWVNGWRDIASIGDEIEVSARLLIP